LESDRYLKNYTAGFEDGKLMTQGLCVFPVAGKGKETDSPAHAPQNLHKKLSCGHPDFSPVRPISNF
jgi:hypothetical protein